MAPGSPGRAAAAEVRSRPPRGAQRRDNSRVTDTNWSRRGLLLGMAASAVSSRAETVKLPRKVRLGIIGFDGHVSDILSPLPDFPDVELIAVADAGSDPGALRSALRNPAVA